MVWIQSDSPQISPVELSAVATSELIQVLAIEAGDAGRESLGSSVNSWSPCVKCCSMPIQPGATLHIDTSCISTSSPGSSIYCLSVGTEGLSVPIQVAVPSEAVHDIDVGCVFTG